jgi:hypothetical protein
MLLRASLAEQINGGIDSTYTHTQARARARFICLLHVVEQLIIINL